MGWQLSKACFRTLDSIIGCYWYLAWLDAKIGEIVQGCFSVTAAPLNALSRTGGPTTNNMIRKRDNEHIQTGTLLVTAGWPFFLGLIISNVSVECLIRSSFCSKPLNLYTGRRENGKIESNWLSNCLHTSQKWRIRYYAKASGPSFPQIFGI